jgi:Zn-dependent peptidase ImmA (M78 family)
MARALGAYLGRTVPGPSLLSSLSTDSQAQSRAFAAEFLAPAEALRQRITSHSVDPEQADDLAQEFGVSSELIRRQIQNHEVANVFGY